jgi:hypothetical protein
MIQTDERTRIEVRTSIELSRTVRLIKVAGSSEVISVVELLGMSRSVAM